MLAGIFGDVPLITRETLTIGEHRIAIADIADVSLEGSTLVVAQLNGYTRRFQLKTPMASFEQVLDVVLSHQRPRGRSTYRDVSIRDDHGATEPHSPHARSVGRREHRRIDGWFRWPRGL